MCLQTDCKAGAELCEVRSGCNRHPGIQACLGEHAGFNDIVHMVQTHDDGPRIDRAHRAGTDRILDQNLRAGENPCLKLCEDRANDCEGDIRSDQNRGQRCDEQIEHFRHMFMQPFLDLTHDEDGDHDRDDVSLIADLLHRE